jgi:hypothetical protein
LPFFKGTDDSHEFFVIDLIVAFCGGMFFREEGNWMEDSCIIILGQHTSRDVVRGISFNYNFSVIVKMPEDGGSGEYLLEGLEGL